jgi:NADPH-dependent 2,4-dienoyl-CoA reductase/sulfur reductase-like enzyme
VQADPLPPVTVDAVPVSKPEVLVVGAGPGGLSAAIAARRAGAEVVVVDERSTPGGQYYKQLGSEASPPPDAQHLDGMRLIAEARRLGVAIHGNVLVWGGFDTGQLAATVGGGTLIFEPRRVIVATGAYERGVPLPGWTLPGVMTTGRRRRSGEPPGACRGSAC